MSLYSLILQVFIILYIGWKIFIYYYSNAGTFASNKNWKVVLQELEKFIPKDRLLFDEEDIHPYTLYKTMEIKGNPDIVVFPETEEEVIRIIRICRKYEMIVLPMGLNTATEGQSVTVQGGLVVNMMKMNKVYSVHPDDYTATVGPGIRIMELNEVLKEYNLFFPVHPSSNPSIGGASGTSGSGTLSPKYLTMKENIISLEAVLPSGDIIKTGGRTVKKTSGYDLTSLFIGSEGTLGIMTKFVVKVVPIPNEISASTCAFDTNQDASKAVVKLIGNAFLGISRLELINKDGINSLNKHMKTSHKESPSLFIEFFGESKDDIASKIEKTRDIVVEFGGSEFKFSNTEDERKLLWDTRMSAFYAFSNCREDCFEIIDGKKSKKNSCKLFATDYCVPISQIGNLISYCDEVFETIAPQLKGNLVVHAGDGNLHHGVLIDYDKPEEIRLMNRIHKLLLKKTLELDGSMSGEHGTGLKMMKFMHMEFNEATLEVMKKIKKAIDPLNMMNPGKIV